MLAVEIFDENIKRNISHPNSFTETDVKELTNNFKIVKEHIIPWIGFKNYVEGKKSKSTNEIILILKKR